MLQRRHIACFVAALFLLVGANVSVPAGDFEDAFAAYNDGDYATAFRLWQPLAEQGDANAQAKIGVMYHRGEGVLRDSEEAARWFRLAAEQGSANAQTILGSIYIDGDGVPQNYSEAAKWLQLAAEQGYANAQTLLGVLYELGLGVPQDFVLAHMWTGLAATQGNERANESQDIVAAKMTPEQIAEAERLAAEWRAAHPQ